jgi:4a-hydroxytetrahydrobiopterin dehydratase
MARMSKAAIAESLEGLAAWKLEGETIAKGYEFPSFPEAIRFVNKVAGLAETSDHHPDILINYRRVTLTLSTHSEGGLTKKDFQLASQIEKERKSFKAARRG